MSDPRWCVACARKELGAMRFERDAGIWQVPLVAAIVTASGGLARATSA